MVSVEAKDEFIEIFRKEFGESLSDEDAFQSAGSILRFCKTLLEPGNPDPKRTQVTQDEWKALRYIHDVMVHKKVQPTVRGTASAIGRSSSRSGLRMLEHLVSRGFLYHDDTGKVVMDESVAGCDTRFNI